MTENTATRARLHSTARVPTPLAARYMTQLCKHFEHKVPAQYDAQSGEINFAMGTCRLQAQPDALLMQCDASQEAELLQLQDVVARHLLRFAFRDDLAVDWVRQKVSAAAS